MMEGAIAMMDSVRASSLALAADMLQDFADEDLIRMADAIVKGLPFEPVWDEGLPKMIIVLITPTIWAELYRRMEVRQLEGCL
jgi:hypothetical protein